MRENHSRILPFFYTTLVSFIGHTLISVQRHIFDSTPLEYSVVRGNHTNVRHIKTRKLLGE